MTLGFRLQLLVKLGAHRRQLLLLHLRHCGHNRGKNCWRSGGIRWFIYRTSIVGHFYLVLFQCFVVFYREKEVQELMKGEIDGEGCLIEKGRRGAVGPAI
jgi:hypothetical protein